MSGKDFRDFVTKMGTHRLFGMGPKDFIDTMPERRWIRRNAALEAMRKDPFRGITADGAIETGLYELRPEGAPVEAAVNAVAALRGVLTDGEVARMFLPLASTQRNRWQNGIPDYETEGLRMDEVSDAVREATMAVLRASLSPEGYRRMRDTMKLNGYLGQLVGAPRLMGQWCYRVHFVGQPSTTEPWGWQLAGHHCCLTCFFVGEQMTVTPSFTGVEPNHCDEGEFAGVNVFDDEEREGLLFCQGLSAEQRSKAILYDTISPDGLPPGRHHHLDGMALGGAYQDNRVIPYEGISGAELTAAQKTRILDLSERYVITLPEGPRRAKMEDIERHFDRLHFCWAGGVEPDSVFYYRIQSPVFMAEFDHHWGVVLDNPTPERFHIHTMVRTPNGNDYGMDLLRLHYETAEHHRGRAVGDAAQAHDHGHAHHHGHEHLHGHGPGQHSHD